MRCSEIEIRTPAHRRPAGRLWWLVLLLAAPVLASAECRPVAPERPAKTGANDFSHGLLWKVETPNARPSYLFGTFHSGDPRITTLPCPVQEAFDAAGSYTMEMIFNGATFTAMGEAMYFSDGRTLHQVLGDPLYRDMLDALGIDEPRRAIAFEHMKPWAVMLAFLGPRQDGGLFLDLKLQVRAILRGKANYALESADEQIAVFNDMSIEDQVTLLRSAIQEARTSSCALEELTQSYLKRDLNGLQAVQDKYKPADARIYNQMTTRLLTQRNRNMAARMRERFREGNAFIAVGAAHLAGESGLLRLLTNDGYHVTRVY